MIIINKYGGSSKILNLLKCRLIYVFFPYLDAYFQTGENFLKYFTIY